MVTNSCPALLARGLGCTISFKGCGFLDVRYLEVIFVLKSGLGEHGSCLLSGIKKHPLLGGCLSITTMVFSIHSTDFVLCREVVRFSEVHYGRFDCSIYKPDEACTHHVTHDSIVRGGGGGGDGLASSS